MATSKKQKKSFNQSLFNKLVSIALVAITGYAILITWIMFQFQIANNQATADLAEQIFHLIR